MMSQKRHKEFKRERFSFVSCVPCSEAEKARVRTRVRSHAAQHRFKEDGRKIKTSRENKDDAIDTEIYGSYPTLSRQSASDTVSEPIFDWISNQNLISLYYSYYTSHRPTESHQDCSDPNDESNVINPQYPFSNSFVSGTLDPFMSYPSNSTSPDFFQECFSYSVTTLWPSLIPGATIHGHNSVISAWTREYLNNETLFTSLNFGALSHKNWNCHNAGSLNGQFRLVEKQKLISCETQSAKMINQSLANPDLPVTDSLILSVICMAYNDSNDKVLHESKCSPFRPPLRRLQWLRLYGGKPSNVIHRNGLAQLIQLKGGINSVKLPGLAAVISFSDILAACKSLSRPQYPFVPLQDDVALTLQERLDFGSVEFALDVGRFIQSGFTVELAEVFQAIKVYVTILDKLDGREETFDDGVWLSKITDQRNIILHSLLSLLPAEHLPDHLSEDQGVLYEACRISGLIFGIGVVFPLPPHISPLPRLAMTLRAILCSNILSGWTSSSTCGILMWSITLGGIAAANTPHRRWFVAELELLTREQSIFNWESHKRILKQMLWQNNACDVAGQNMWAEVEELRLLGKIV